MPVSKKLHLEVRKKLFHALQLARGVDVQFDLARSRNTKVVSIDMLLSRSEKLLLLPELVGTDVRISSCDADPRPLRKLYAGDPETAKTIDKLLTLAQRSRKSAGLGT